MKHIDQYHWVFKPASSLEQRAAHRAVLRGQLDRLLPGVFGPRGCGELLEARAAALRLVDPDAIITGAAAAHLSWWPELPVGRLVAVRPQRPRPAPGFAWEQRHVPLDLTMEAHGLRLACPALTVLDLIPMLGGNAIDQALRRRATTLPHLWRALELTPSRRDNVLRRTLLEDSRDQPWSEAERHLHRYVRLVAHPQRYRTNYPMRLSDGRRAFLDVALPDLLLFLEADGYEYHGTRAAFEHDRDRDTDLAMLGWQGHRFSASFLMNQPEAAAHRIAVIIEQRARQLGLRDILLCSNLRET